MRQKKPTAAEVAAAKVILAGLDAPGPAPSPAPAPNLTPTVVMPPSTSEPPQLECRSPRKDGGKCGGTPAASGYCPHHDPKWSTEDKKKWSQRGALSGLKKRAIQSMEVLRASLPEEMAPLPMPLNVPTPSFETLGTTRAYLERMSAKVEGNQLAPSQAGAIAQFAALGIRVAELQLEADMLAVELEAARQSGAGPKVIIPSVPRG